MWKFVPWRLVLLIVGLLLVALFAAGQAVTVAWLSAFPERASQLEALEIKFWGYATLSAILVIIDLVLFVRLVKQIKDRVRRESMMAGSIDPH